MASEPLGACESMFCWTIVGRFPGEWHTVSCRENARELPKTGSPSLPDPPRIAYRRPTRFTGSPSPSSTPGGTSSYRRRSRSMSSRSWSSSMVVRIRSSTTLSASFLYHRPALQLRLPRCKLGETDGAVLEEVPSDAGTPHLPPFVLEAYRTDPTTKMGTGSGLSWDSLP